MTLHDALEQLAARRADCARLRAHVDGAALLDEVLALLEDVDGRPAIGADGDLTTAEAGELLGRAARTIERACRAGEFPSAYRTSGASGDWRIPPGDVEAYRRTRAKPTAISGMRR